MLLQASVKSQGCTLKCPGLLPHSPRMVRVSTLTAMRCIRHPVWPREAEQTRKEALPGLSKSRTTSRTLFSQARNLCHGSSAGELSLFRWKEKHNYVSLLTVFNTALLPLGWWGPGHILLSSVPAVHLPAWLSSLWWLGLAAGVCDAPCQGGRIKGSWCEVGSCDPAEWQPGAHPSFKEWVEIILVCSHTAKTYLRLSHL